jgi:hypothetical protein
MSLIQTSILSFLLIFFVHNIITYLQQTLTVYKEKDMRPIKKYEEIISKIEEVQQPKVQSTNIETNKMEYNHNFDMKKELKEYIRNHL